jgi:hypothetical protein
MDYPTLSIKPASPMPQDSQKKTLRSPPEAGYVITRGLWTRAKKTWHIDYPAMPVADYNTLLAFFEGSAGGGAEIFNWTHPITSTIYEVRFLEDKLPAEYLTFNLVSCSFNLEEV